MKSTATDMCRGDVGHVYRLRSFSGSRSTSWNMKQSQLCSFNASANPMFISIPRLNVLENDYKNVYTLAQQHMEQCICSAYSYVLINNAIVSV